MPRVICTLPNASASINGIAFTLDRGQMVSEEVDEATAARFASIPGYQMVAPPPANPIPADPAAPPPVPEQKQDDGAPATGEATSPTKRPTAPKQKPAAVKKATDEKPTADPAPATEGAAQGAAEGATEGADGTAAAS